MPVLNQTRLGVRADALFHPESPLIVLLGLLHPRVTLTALVLGRTGRRDDGGVDRHAGLEHQPLLGQTGVEYGQDLR
jgi:hypothetical protein